MAESWEILLALGGLLLTVWGSTKPDPLTITIGLALILLTIYFRLSDLDDEVGYLQNQIHTSKEIEALWKSIGRIRNEIKSKRKK